MNPARTRWLYLLAAAAGGFLVLRFCLPLLLPFLLGLGLALAAEPMVRFLRGKCHLGRVVASGIGVSLTFCLLVMIAMALGALVIRELSNLSGVLPEVEAGIRSGMSALSGWLLDLAARAPEGLRGLLTRNVTDFFSGSSRLLDKVTDFLLQLASGILSRVPGSALTLATAVISSFMISGRLPALRAAFRGRFPEDKLQPVLQALRGMKKAVLGWLKAQASLSGVTFCVTALGFFLLGLPHALLWAALVAAVDAFPVLGSGTVLVPWSLVAFLQGDRGLAFALLGIYAGAALTRSVLEPRLVGRQLGLDPLATLVALYVGYRLFGLPGMLLSPMLAVAVMQLIPPQQKEE